MGLFDRDTDMSDSEDDDGPQFEPVPGTEVDGSGDGADDVDRDDVLSKLVGVNLRDDDFSGTLKRAVDVEAGVVLYAYANGNAGGLAAVPIDDTRILDE